MTGLVLLRPFWGFLVSSNPPDPRRMRKLAEHIRDDHSIMYRIQAAGHLMQAATEIERSRETLAALRDWAEYEANRGSSYATPARRVLRILGAGVPSVVPDQPEPESLQDRFERLRQAAQERIDALPTYYVPSDADPVDPRLHDMQVRAIRGVVPDPTPERPMLASRPDQKHYAATMDLSLCYRCHRNDPVGESGFCADCDGVTTDPETTEER